MIRSLLVAYDGSHGARVALQHAVDVASRCDGRICLLTVGSSELEADGPVPDGVDLVALAEERDTSSGAAADPLADGDEVLQEAVNLCRDLTVRCVAQPGHGDVAGVLARGSCLSDLVIMGRDALLGIGAADAPARTARRVAAGAACPVMITPREYQPVRSVAVFFPATEAGGRALRVASELAMLLRLRLDAFLLDSNPSTVGSWARDAKRYLVDHGHLGEVQTRRPPVGSHIDSLVGARQSPLIVIPRGSTWDALRRRDYLSAAMTGLGASIVVQP